MKFTKIIEDRAETMIIPQYLGKFDLAPIFTEEEFRHWFFPQIGIVDSFVVDNPVLKKITDMVSYYTLPSSVMHHQTHKTLRAAYSFYNVSTVTPWQELMTDALISAKNVRNNNSSHASFQKCVNSSVMISLYLCARVSAGI